MSARCRRPLLTLRIATSAAVQIWSEDGKMPKDPPSSEYATVDGYTEMYGKAMRTSLQQVLNNATKAKKRVPDALFLPSCFQHGVDMSETITPTANGAGAQSWPVLLGDWFFEQNLYQQYHRLVESCPTDLPCNTNPLCTYSAEHPLGPTPAPPSGPTPPPTPSSCSAELAKDGCLAGSEQDCLNCASEHEADLGKAGCQPAQVQQLCGAPPPAAPTPAPGGCAAQFKADACLPNSEDDCHKCVHKHKSDLDAAGCTSGQARDMCTA